MYLKTNHLLRVSSVQTARWSERPHSTMIRRDQAKLSISQQYKLVQLSRSAFYYAPVRNDGATLDMMKENDRVFTKYPFFGSRQITAYLRREARRVISNGVTFDNTERPHSSLQGRTPKKAYWGRRDKKLTA